MALDRKIRYFLESLLVEPEVFRYQVLISLTKLFGFKNLNFWLADSDGHLFDPITITKENERFIEEYIAEYYKISPLNPMNLDINYALNNEVIYLQNYMEPKEFKRTEFYKFLKKYNAYHVLDIYLKSNNRLIGIIAMSRSEQEKGFDNREILLLKQLTRYISRMLYLNLSYMEAYNKKRLLEYCTDHSFSGMVIFDPSLKIHYYNPSAYHICSEIITTKSSHPIKTLLIKITTQNTLTWRNGLEQMITTPFLTRVNIKIIPILHQKKNLYMLILSEDILRRDKNSDSLAQANLTFREQEVLHLLTRGSTNEEIANELFISINTVKKHLKSIYKKMNVPNRTSLLYRMSQGKGFFDF